MAVVRKQILLNAAQNKRLQRLRAATGISESEIVRRALDAYDPDKAAASIEGNDDVRELLDELVAQNGKTADALQLAETEIAATEAFLRELKAEREPARPVRRVRRKAARRGASR